MITSWEPISERIIEMNITLCGEKITIIGVYAVNHDSLVKENERKDFFESLHQEISQISKYRKLKIIGNSNGITGKKIEDCVVGQYGEDVTNDNGHRIMNDF